MLPNLLPSKSAMESEHQKLAGGSAINIALIESTTGQLLESTVLPIVPQSETKIIATPYFGTGKGEMQTLLQASPLKGNPEETNVKDAAVSNSSAGFMDKAAPISATDNSHIDEPLVPPATRLRRRLENTKDLIVCPGVYDGLSARIAMAEGCDAMYMV